VDLDASFCAYSVLYSVGSVLSYVCVCSLLCVLCDVLCDVLRVW